MGRLFIILFVLGLGSPAQAGDLVPALRAGNTRELLRLGSEKGAKGLAPAILGNQRPLALAAIHASLGARDGFALLGPLAQAAAKPDRSIALIAVAVAAEIAQQSEPGMLEEEEVGDAQLLEWYRAWIRIARDGHRWVDIRIYAFETATRLHQLVSPTKRPALDLAPLLAEEEAELRSAVLTLSPAHLAIEDKASILLVDDPSDQVALSAAQVICGPLGLRRKELPVLSEEATQRVVRLATDETWDIAARADLGPCLAANPTPESRKALAVLTLQSPLALRPSLTALGREQ